MELITTNPDWFDKALNTEHKSKFVEVNGARMEYMEWGNPENQSVIMLHGTMHMLIGLNLLEHSCLINITLLL